MRDTVSPIGEEVANGLVYNPGHLLDTLIERLQLKNDGALAKVLNVAGSTITRIRRRRIPIAAAVLIRMHEVTGLTIGDLRYLMGDRRKKFQLSHAQGKPKNLASRYSRKRGEFARCYRACLCDRRIRHSQPVGEKLLAQKRDWLLRRSRGGVDGAGN